MRGEGGDAVTFEVRVATDVAAPPAVVYAYVSDLTRAGEWSPECRGGQWVSGTPGDVGSVFEGRNYRATEVVSWAPVVRGEWTTESEVVEAKPPHAFRWAMRNRAKQAQDSVWSFEVDEGPEGSVLTHAFRMGKRTEGLSEILSKLSEDDQQRFLAEWSEKLRGDMGQAVARIKSAVEAGGAGTGTTR